MKRIFHPIIATLIILTATINTVFAATECSYYQFTYQKTGEGNNYSYHIRTDNYEDPSVLDVSSSNANPSEKLPLKRMSGYMLSVLNAKGERVALCLYGLNGVMMQNPGESVVCPTIIPKPIGDDAKGCEIALPSDLSKAS